MFRKFYLLGFILSVCAIIWALVMQYGFKLEPCPLCVLSRVTVAVAGILFLVAALHNPKRFKWVYTALVSATTLAGVGLNVRHLWLQSLPPDKVPACGPSLDYLMDALPLIEVLKTVLSGGGECAEVVGRFLGLSLPAWTLLLFLGLLVIAMIPQIKKG